MSSYVKYFCETLGNPVHFFRSILIGKPCGLLTGYRNRRYRHLRFRDELSSVNSASQAFPPSYLCNPSELDCSRFVVGSLLSAFFLHFPNRSWLRSFSLAWGLGGKRAKMMS